MSPKKFLIKLTIVCAVITVLALVIGLLTKNSRGTATYVVQEENVTK